MLPAAPLKALKILTVDDHALVREGLRHVLKGLDESVEVLDAATCTKAFEIAAQHPDLDLVLLDYHLPDMTGMSALEVFAKRHPELPVIMLSGSVNPGIMRQVLAKGAAGFITKSGLCNELLLALRVVMAGDVYIPPELAGAPSPEQPHFAPRQQDVLDLMRNGLSNKDIANTLFVSEATVKTHVTAILRKFGVQNRVQAVLAANQAP